MKMAIVRQTAVVLAVLATITMNGLANALPLNGQTTGAISDRFDVYFVPAGYVFSIWGLIYLGLIAYAVYQALPAQRENERLQGIAGLFVVSSAANIAWLFFWHYEYFVWSMAAMLLLLLTLIGIYLRLGINRVDVSAAEKWLVHIPFSIYLGWITVATIANATTLLAYLDWQGWGISEPVWAVIMLLVAAVVAWLMSLTRGDVAYLLVLVWAFVGIGVKQADTAVVANAAWIATGVVGTAVVAAFIIKWRSSPAERPA